MKDLAINLHKEYLDWKVEKKDISVIEPVRAIPKYKALVRADTGHVLSIVSNKYHPIQNNIIAETADMIFNNTPSCESAGNFKDGEIIWYSMNQGEFTLKDSPIQKRLLLVNFHDGKNACKLLLTALRVICKNTLMAAIRNASNYITIRHSQNASEQLEFVKNELHNIDTEFNKFKELALRMQSMSFTDIQMKRLTEIIFPIQDEEKNRRAVDMLLANRDNSGLLTEITNNIPTRTHNIRETMFSLFEGGTGNEPVRGTAWAAYNAVTEYYDHYKTYRNTRTTSASENKMNSILLGQTAKQKQVALEHILEMVEI